MKFLHTSDWHIGRTIRSHSRNDEHRAVFAEIIDIARQEHIDAVLLTGDVFHERRPPVDAQMLLAETLATFARHKIPVVVIPGNHDDPRLLRALKPWGDLVHVYIISEVSEEIDSLIVPLDGVTEMALIGCLPYVHPHQVVSTADGAGTQADARLLAYQAKLQDYFRALEARMKQRDRQAVAIMLAHVDIQGSALGGGEWRSNVFSLPGSILPAHVHYVALGHIHKPQHAPGAKTHTRYAGSILQMDFGERDQQKSVCLIDAHPGKPAAVTQIALTKGKRLLRRSGTVEAILAQAPDFTDAWVEVVLSSEKRTTALVDRVRALPAVISLRFEDVQDAPATSSTTDGQHPTDRPARELFHEYYKSKKKTDPEPQLLALFERLYQEEALSVSENFHA